MSVKRYKSDPIAFVEEVLRDPETGQPFALYPRVVGVDASTKRDSTAIVACTWDHQAKKVRLVWHRTW